MSMEISTSTWAQIIKILISTLIKPIQHPVPQHQSVARSPHLLSVLLYQNSRIVDCRVYVTSSGLI